MNISANFAQMRQVSQNAYRLDQSNKASYRQTVRALNEVDSQRKEATSEVIHNAMTLRNVATSAKGQLIDIMA